MDETRSDFFPELPGYEILAELGRGGVSTVYLARHLLLDRQVAIKVMAPALAVEEGFNKRFIREGQTVARLAHSGIVTVYDVAVTDHRPYIAMEYLPGGSLKDRMREPLSPGDAFSLLRSIANSLGYAHDHGVFHRDVKPENILFRDNGDPVISDFGIAKSDSQNTALTSVGIVVGTPRYISPEQAQGHGCDARSDIYALGVILYEMLAGRPPYDVKGSMSLLYAHINDPIPRLPEGLEKYQALLDDLLAKEPKRRVQDCASLVQRIDELVEGEIPPVSTPQTTGHSVSISSSPAGFLRSRPSVYVLVGLSIPFLALLAWSQAWMFDTGPDGARDFKKVVTSLLTNDDDAPEGVKSDGDDDLDPEAAFTKARALDTGAGGEQNRVAALRLYEQAASGGHALSQYHLGIAYGNGDGVDRDEERAVYWLARAANADLHGAAYNLVLAKIFGPEPDMAEAASLALELADKKYTPVYRILGWMYNTGTGVDSSFTQSVRWSVKTMVGDVTGKSGAPERVVEHWERELKIELANVWDSERPEVK